MTSIYINFEANNDIYFMNHVMKKGSSFWVNALTTSTFATVFNQGSHCFNAYDCEEFIMLEFNGCGINWTDTLNSRSFKSHATVYCSPAGVLIISKADIQNRLLETMYWTRNKRGDFTIQCHNKSFLVHKEILRCSSSKLLSSYDYSKEVMKQIIRFIYLGDLLYEELNSNLLLDIYEASKYFQMETLEMISQTLFISTLKKDFEYSIIEKVMRQKNSKMQLALERTIDQLGGKRLMAIYNKKDIEKNPRNQLKN